MPYYNLNSKNSISSPILVDEAVENFTSSTPNLISNEHTINKAHFYSNAAPTKIEGNVFRYDFVEQVIFLIYVSRKKHNIYYIFQLKQENAPAVNRSLKPKSSKVNCSTENTGPSKTSNSLENKEAIKQTNNLPVQCTVPQIPPCINRNLKPVITCFYL